MANWDSEAAWLSAWGCRAAQSDKPGFGQDLTFLSGRPFAEQLGRDDQAGLSHWRFEVQRLGATGTFNPAADTLVVTRGFPWLAEVILDLGGNVWATVTSVPIVARLDEPAVDLRPDVRALTLTIDILDPDASAQFQAAGAGKKGTFRNVVTELLLDDWPMAQMTEVLDACDALRTGGVSRVFHLVTAQDTLRPGQSDPAEVANQLTLAEWAALRPSHFWVDLVTGNVMGGD